MLQAEAERFGGRRRDDPSETDIDLGGVTVCTWADESVALGVGHTGRVITAAALIMSISFAALIAANVSFMRMFGVGLTLAVLVDATLVRMVLVPAFMHVMGKWNWWAPKPLRWLHRRVEIDSREVATMGHAASLEPLEPGQAPLR